MKRIITILILSFLTISFLKAQYQIDWEKNYGTSTNEVANSVINTDDSCYLVLGSNKTGVNSSLILFGGNDVVLMKIDKDGFVLWEKSFGNNDINFSRSICRTTDGNFVIAGVSEGQSDVYTSNSGSNVWVFKVNQHGFLIWERILTSPYDVYITSIEALDNGTFAVSGMKDIYIQPGTIAQFGNPKFHFIKFYLSGYKQIEKVITSGVSSNMIKTSDNGFVLTGYGQKTKVAKLNSFGNVQWQKSINDMYASFYSSIVQNEDSTYVIIGGSYLSNNDFYIAKLDKYGEFIWKKYYGGTQIDHAHCIIKNQSGYIISGSSLSSDINVSANYGGKDVWVIQIDELGNLLWEQNYGGSKDDIVTDMIRTKDGGILLSGYSFSSDNDLFFNNGGKDFWLLKLKPYVSKIYGKVVFDANENCFLDTNESIFPNLIVGAKNMNSLNTNLTNSLQDGSYSMNVDTASYELSILSDLHYFNSSLCSTDTQSININTSNTIDTVNIYLNKTISCPYLEVDISTTRLRRCMTSVYYVNYNNSGSAVANNAYVEVEFNDKITVDNASIPWNLISGNTYSFPIGNVGFLENGGFSINVTVNCDTTTFIGEVLCVEAHIYPDTTCSITDNWSRAELESSVRCISQDSIEFSLQNIGLGNMNDSVNVKLLEGDKLLKTTAIKLNQKEEIKWAFPINTMSYRIISDQPNYHPYKTFTTDFVSLCNYSNLASPGPITDSFSLSFPNDAEAPYVAIDCQEITGSYDPNDKSVSPIGVTEKHLIKNDIDLTYKIRFQNTGNDTAFTVVITDYLSKNLDITSIRVGAHSHSYQMKIIDNSVKFIFNNILLPDSNKNEVNSHGFIQFKIKQKTNNNDGVIIKNEAKIFFDYNPPIITNKVINEVGSITLKYVKTIETNNSLVINVYPNPSSENVVFEFENLVSKISIEIYTTFGKLIKIKNENNTSKIRINHKDIDAGVYFFIVKTENNKHTTGKIIFK